MTYEGKPFSEAEILFNNPAQGVYIKAVLADDGTYELKTAGRAGLPLGTYQIAIRPPTVEAVTGGPQPTLPPRKHPDIPQKYLDAKTSGLTLTVKPGDNPFDVELQP